ncbi:Golgin subfamily A member 2 [Paragonimus heterotremus]|uniref:Golgin subfamily A member 2 n=1 Tax=Paragonimus heterotremus TaxID=100268 RepID=A0A8J4SKW9_9TREM|nr:Golgin subfamily A member 2 [Paragonimus heterotremus]
MSHSAPMKSSPTLTRTQSSSKPRSLAEYFNGVANDNMQSEDLLVPQSSFFLPTSEIPETESLVQNKSTVGSGHSIKNVANSSTNVFTPNPSCSHMSTTTCPAEPNMPVSSSKFAVPAQLFNEQQTSEVVVNSRIEVDETLGRTPTATTEKMLQLSQQLNVILQTSEHLTTSFTSSTGGLSSYSADAELSGICSAGGSDIHVQSCSPALPGHLSSESASLVQNPMTLSSTTPFKLPAIPSGHTNSYVRELEERNVELAALLEKRDRAHERTLAKLASVQEQATNAISAAAIDRSNFEQSANRDLSRAQEQIRVHAQTIGVLVAEKTEMQTKISHLERMMGERSQEIEDADERLRDARQHALQLDRTVVQLKSELERTLNKNSELVSQIGRLKSEIRREKSCRENLDAELQEAYSRLNTRGQEVTQLELNLSEVRRQLDLSQVYASQLGLGDAETGSNCVDDVCTGNEYYSREAWLTERNSLTNRIQELEITALQASKERGRLESQYKAFVAQVEQQADDLRSQLSDANKSNQELQFSLESSRRTLREKEDELTECKHKLELTHVQQPLPIMSTFASVQDKQLQSYVDDEDQRRQICELERLTAQQQCDLGHQVQELVSLKEKLAAAEGIIHEKDLLLADRDTVIATATSERVALSRAIEQNQMLKQRLLELQEAFVRTSNQNMELTTDLQKEQCALKESSTVQHDYREQLERLQKHCAEREAQFNELTEKYKMLVKDYEQLQALNARFDCEQVQRCTTSEQPVKGEQSCLISSPTADFVTKLVQDVQNQQLTIDSLSARSELCDSLTNRFKLLLGWLEEQRSDSVTKTNAHETEDPIELFVLLEQSMKSLLSQRDKEVAMQAEKNRQHMVQMEQLPSLEQWQLLQVTHKQLETKFLDCMRKLSQASEDHAKSEAIVAQLEMEASTVGEYVTLFAHRRAAASRRAKARELLLTRLVEDRRRLRSRLIKMQNLIPETQLRQPFTENCEVNAQVLNANGYCGGDEPGDTFVTEFRCLLNEICSKSDEVETEEGFSILSDEDVPVEQREHETLSNNSSSPNCSTVPMLEQLRQQALQHDCPHCQCCVGTLLEV